MTKPLATIVVVPRERFAYSQTSLESVYANTRPPFQLVYVDGGSPTHVKRYLETQAKEKGFRLLRSEYFLSPNQARNMGLGEVNSKYVVFLDNDAVVAPGWLEALVACAEETDAAAVGPLYCIGNPLHEVIHMAGGQARIQEGQGKRQLQEKHQFCNRRVSELRPQLRREPCELIEFHCMLVRRTVFDELGRLDEALLSTREHIDLCLTVRQAGGVVWFEPNSIVTYVPPPPFEWSDIPFYLLRWSDSWAESSLRHLQKKWNLDASPELLMNNWLRPHRNVAFGKLPARLQRYLGKRVGDRVVRSLESVLTRGAIRKWNARPLDVREPARNSTAP
jgi:GT2 family glycosyltransferase